MGICAGSTHLQMLKVGPEPKKYSIVEYFPSVGRALCLNPRLPLLPKYVRFTIIINLKYIYTEVDYTNTKKKKINRDGRGDGSVGKALA